MDKLELEATWENFFQKRDDENKKKLVEHYFPYVKKIAEYMVKRFKNHITKEELMSYGVDGLYSAIEKFDKNIGAKFETYSYIRIRGAMIDGIRANDWVPRSVRKKQAEIEETKLVLERKDGKMISYDNVLEHLGIKKDFYKRKSKFQPIVISSIEVSHNTDIDNDDTQKDCNNNLIANNLAALDSNLIRKEFFSKLMGKNFTGEEKKIVYYFYFDNYNITEIAEKLQMSESKVCQMHQEIISRLKTRIKVNPEYFEDIVSIIGNCNDHSSLF